MKYIKLFENFQDGSHSTILMFGPQGVGKSTLSKELSKKLGMPIVGSDDVIDQGDWSSEDTWSKGWSVRKGNEFIGMKKYLSENLGKRVILDIGGSHGVWEGAMLKEILDMINDYPNRFLIIPSPNEEENTEFLRGRLLKRELGMHPDNIKYWDAVLSGDERFGDKFDPIDREEFLERIRLVKSENKFRNMALSQRNSSRERFDALSKNPEFMVYTNSPDQKFDFAMNRIEDYSKFFIDTMLKSGVANHVIYNKDKSSEQLMNEVISKLVL